MQFFFLVLFVVVIAPVTVSALHLWRSACVNGERGRGRRVEFFCYFVSEHGAKLQLCTLHESLSQHRENSKTA